MTQHFFGYGSLVNRATHSYPNGQRASIAGWRRVWVHCPELARSFLSVTPDPTCTIKGLMAEVPGNDWAALDLREAGYARAPVLAEVDSRQLPVQVYAIPECNARPPAEGFPVLLSYIDAVVQGFLAEYGTQGAAHFFATTTGWEAPILNDRTTPQYPRAQSLTDAERSIVDAGLQQCGAVISAGG